MHLDLDMGKYVFYVWTSYGLSAAALMGLIAASLLAHRRRRKLLEALQKAVDQKVGET